MDIIQLANVVANTAHAWYDTQELVETWDGLDTDNQRLLLATGEALVRWQDRTALTADDARLLVIWEWLLDTPILDN